MAPPSAEGLDEHVAADGPPADGPAPDASEPAGPEPGVGGQVRFGPGFVVGLAVVLVLLLGIGAGLRSLSSPSTGEEGWHGTPVDEPTPRPAFTLTDTDGQPYDFAARTAGTMTVLFFGFTNCPDVCPITMATLAGALQTQPGLALEVVFVTVDPGRDDPERLESWVRNFDRRFVGLTGTTAEVDAALVAAGLPPATRGEPDAEGDYDVGHGATAFLITPDDQVRLVYPFGVRQGDWVDDLTRATQRDDWA